MNGSSTADASSLPDGWLCKLTIDEGPTVAVREGVRSSTSRRASDSGMLPISLDDCLQLLDMSDGMVRKGKAGSIPPHLSPTLERLGIRVSLWSQIVTNCEDWFGHVVGATETVARRAAQVRRNWFRGKSRCAEAFA